MATVFLDAGDSFTINDNNTTVHGAGGTSRESVVIGSGVTGAAIDQNVEHVQLGSISGYYGLAFNSYQFLQTGNHSHAHKSL